MSLPGTSPRSHTITTTTTATTTTTTTSTQPTTTVTTVTTGTAPARSSPPKDDSPPGRSKKTVPPRSPRAMPVPMLRLRSTSSSAELTPPPRRLPPPPKREGTVLLSQSNPLPSISSAAPVTAARTSEIERSEQRTDATPIQAHSAPTLQIVRKSIPLAQMKKIEAEHKLQKLADLIVNDLISDDLSAARLPMLGRVDSAFYIDRLPPEFKPLAAGAETPTLSSSKLLQRYFAADFRDNLGWGAARTLYSNFRFTETKRPASGSGLRASEADEDTRSAETMRMQGMAEVIVRTLLGYPPTVERSPLPGKLIRFLIICDQRLHAKLLGSGMKVSFSTEQIRAGRLALLTHLVATRLLQPMLSTLAARVPMPSEVQFLTLLLKGLVAGVEQLSDSLFNKSFAGSPLALQQQATEKMTREKIESRIRQLQTKPSSRHVRTRSADTEPVSPRTLRTVEEARSLRQLQKTVAIADALESEWAALDEANREITENLAVDQARNDLQQFNQDQLEQLVTALLGDRSDSDEIPVMPISPRRAQPLDDSEEGAVTTANTFTTTTTANATTTTITAAATTTTTTTAIPSPPTGP